MSDAVRIVEVGPRDGLQNEKTPISVADRIAFIEALIAAGLHTVEVGAFVSPKAIPQMVGSDQVLRHWNLNGAPGPLSAACSPLLSCLCYARHPVAAPAVVLPASGVFRRRVSL